GSVSGTAAWPGPPASAITAELGPSIGARWRRMARVRVPGVTPLGSSGTLRCPQAKLLLSPHGAKAICAPAGAVDTRAQAPAVRSATAVFLTESRTVGIY